ncbi:MAG: hypothetical protein EA408_04835 [Marinilabiliales bacterium]|nr:MAG: hypothetical protein EA408_04835 [Marinilabiliales bacterium]
MHIREIHIDGFGIYSDFRLQGLEQGVNVILGRNEAGKSTLHRFLRYTLFGYPHYRDQRMAPLKGGGHGGRIIATLATGDELVVDRKGNGQLSVYTGGQEFGSESVLSRLLGNTNESIYNKVYAFTLDELVSLESLTQSGVEDRMFSIGMGLGDISLADLEDGIRSRIDKVHKPGGRGRMISEILKSNGGLKEEIASRQALLPRRRELKEELERTQREAGRVQELAREKTAAAGRAGNLLKCHESCVRYLKAAAELEKLPGPLPWPERGMELMGKLEERKEEYAGRLHALIKGEAGNMGIDELKDLVAGTEFNSKIVNETGRVEYLKSNLSMYTGLVTDYRKEATSVSALKDRLNGLVTGIDRSWTPETITDISGGDIHRSAISSFISDLEEVRNKIIKAEALAGANRRGLSIRDIRIIAVLISAVLLIAAIPAFYYSVHVAGGALVLAALAVLAGSRMAMSRRPDADPSDEVNQLREQEKKIISLYNEYMSGRIGIKGTIPAGTALRVLDEIDNAAGILERIRETEAKQEERKQFIDEYEKVVMSVAPVAGIDAVAEGSMDFHASRIIEIFKDADEKRKLKEKYSEELERRTKEIDAIEKRVAATEKEIARLLDAAGAKDPEDFSRKHRLNERIGELTAERDRTADNIEIIMGSGRLEEVVEWFSGRSKEETEAEVRELELAVSELDAAIRQLNVKSGEITAEIARIEKESDMASLLSALETGKTMLGKAVGDWLAGRMAIELLTGVKTSYEEEKQPAVISSAAGYFSDVTGGEYARLQVSADSKEMRVYHREGMYKAIGELSRGTREQLLICLRLGFIEEYEKQSEPLPLVMDEVLVNSDPDRVARMAGLLHKFCTERQMIVFSCHPGVAGLWENKKINVIELDSSLKRH